MIADILFLFSPPVSLTMALNPARYTNNFLPPMQHSMPNHNREPSPTKDNSDNDGKFEQLFATNLLYKMINICNNSVITFHSYLCYL